MKKKREPFLFQRKLAPFLLKMRIALFLVLVGVLQGFAGVNAQTKFNLSIENSSLETIFRTIERQEYYTFLYSAADVDGITVLNIKLKDAGIEEVMTTCLRNTSLTYKLNKNLIIIKKQAPATKISQSLIKIVGVVKDVAGEPIIGATVTLKGTTLGVSTDLEGKFQLNVPQTDPVILVFSYIGMVRQEVKYTGQPMLSVVMKEEVTQIDEVVVTGIFTKAKESYTGAVTIITAKELKQAGNRNVLTSIRNIDPSFYIAENIEIGSDPNRLPDISIRGGSSMEADLKDLQTDTRSKRQQNQPLYIMDGFEISLQRMMDMDEDQIEAITLLKDASATAMYGARGANGVVVITTKKPENGKLNITYRGGVNMEFPDLTSYDLLNAEEKLAYEESAGIYKHTDVRLEQHLLDLLNRRRAEVARGVNTYWLKYPVRTGVGTKHSLRLDGGNDDVRYAASIGYNNIAGVMKESVRNTLTGNLYLSYKFKNFTFQNDFNLTSNRSGNSPHENFYTYTKQNPYWKPYDDEGKIKKVLENEIINGATFYKLNPLYDAQLPYKNESDYKSIQNNFAVEWQILEGLLVRGRFGINWQQGRSDVYLSAQHSKFDDFTGVDFDRRGSYTYGTDYMLRYEGDLTLNYSRTFADKHQFYVGLNYNVSEENSESYSIKAEGYSGANMDFFPLGASFAQNGTPEGYEEISRRMGLTLNANYTYDQRYYMDISAKAEGSSKFGANKRIAPFWSVGLGWNIHKEHWMGEGSWLNVMRLRGSYGISGSQNFNPYQALTSFAYYDTEKYKHWSGSYLLAMGNKDLGWQQVKQFNVGLETQLFHSILRVNIDFYNNLTDDLLSDITLPLSSGFGSYKANIGQVRNRGVEVGVNAYLIRNTEKAIIWSVGGTLAHNTNKIMKISNSLDFLNQKLNKDAGANPSFLFKEGESMNTIYVVESKGIDPSNGREIFIKQDGSKTYDWDAKDKIACGISEPKVQGNFNTLLRWKNISFNAIFGYRMGGQLYNQTLIDRIENVDPWMNTDRRVFYDRWKNPGDKTFYKSVKDVSNTKASSRFVMDENTLECRSLNLSYDIESKWLKKNLSLNYLSAAVYAEDVFYISTVKRERGLNYPFSRKFSFSLTARF